MSGHLSPKDKAAFAEAYQPLVLKTLNQFARFLPDGGDRESLYGAMNLAMAFALRRFDPARKLAFGPYLRTWLRGAALREIHRQNLWADHHREAPAGELDGNPAREENHPPGMPLVVVVIPDGPDLKARLEKITANAWATVIYLEPDLAAEIRDEGQWVDWPRDREAPPE